MTAHATPRPGGLPDGFAEIVHPNMPGEAGVVPVSTLDHWAELGWQLSDNPANPTPAEAPVDDPGPAGTANPSSQED